VSYFFYGVPERYRNSLLNPRMPWPGLPLALVWGEAGTGKTHSVCDASYRHLRAITGRIAIGRYVTHATIMADIGQAIDAHKGRAAVVNTLKAADVLVVDEFASMDHDLRDTSLSTLREVVFARADRLDQRTFLITNRSPAWLAAHLDEPFASRLTPRRGVCQVMPAGPIPEDKRGIGGPHRVEDPAWMADCLGVIADLGHPGEPRVMTMQEVDRFRSEGQQWFLARRIRNLPAEAMTYVQENFPQHHQLFKALTYV
jgi:hypothetical protein